jgi:YcaO-like protein with predicted kinase domain
MPPDNCAPSSEALKTYTRGTHRRCAPEKTMSAVCPHMATMGITRVAGITGLDRIGIPVYMASRPNSRSVAVSQGKGLTVEAARVSALMEAVESWHAEQPLSQIIRGSERQLRSSSPLAGVQLPLCQGSAFHEDLEIYWVPATALRDDSYCVVPFELVHTDFTVPGPDPVHCFSASTNGLASGNSLLEASVHALCELIERDATTLWHLCKPQCRRDHTVDLQTIDDPDGRYLLERFDAANIDVVVWDVTTDIGVACFHALIVDRDERSGIPEFGSGCHPVRAVALVRALTEAAQARTTYIAGSRDDFDPAWYSEEVRKRRWSACRGLYENAVADLHYLASPNRYHDRFDAELQYLLDQLESVGISDVACVDLTQPTLGIAVVRVVAAGLEGPLTGSAKDYVRGERAIAKLRALMS